MIAEQIIKCNKNGIKIINFTKLDKVIDKRIPRGSFIVECDDNTYIGIDNTDGYAFLEDFYNVNDCIRWLNCGEQLKFLIE